jgi:hypothetical protein
MGRQRRDGFGALRHLLTPDTCSHVLPNVQEKVVEAMEDIFKEDDRASRLDDHGVMLRTTLSMKISMSGLNYYPLNQLDWR